MTLETQYIIFLDSTITVQTSKKKTLSKTPEEYEEECDDQCGESFDDIFENQFNYWKLPSEEEFEQSRNACKSNVSLNEVKEIITDVSVILNRVAEKSERLIGNFTTNLAESWMAIRAKFDGGKFVNRCARGSWNTRCYGGALRKNLGPAWSSMTFQKVTGTQAGCYFNKGVRKQSQKVEAAKKYKMKETSKTVRRKRKLESMKQSSSKSAKLAYGSQLDDTPDVTVETLQELCNRYSEKLKKNDEQLKKIELASHQQHNSEIWKQERLKRLTSSNFGKVMSRRTTNVSTNLVKNILYSTFTGNINTIRGLAQEENTIIEYTNKKSNVNVKKLGLTICKEHQYLAASTDGLVVEDGKDEGLIEIKNFLQNNKYTIKEAIKKVPSFCLHQTKNEICLKKNHEIHYQIQGQLNIINKPWCDFVLRRTNPYDIYIERIFRDKVLWNTVMVPKLKCFYMQFILPELASPRHATYTGIRKPKSPWYTQQILSNPKAQRERQKTFSVVGQSKNDTNIPSASTPDNEDTKQSHPSPQTDRHNHIPVAGQSYCDANNSNIPCTRTSDNKFMNQSQPKSQRESNKVAGPSTSDTNDAGIQSAGFEFNKPLKRSRRQHLVKFVGRTILHLRYTDDREIKKDWCNGTVLEVTKGKDGTPGTVYSVLYKGVDSPAEVPNLHDFLETGCLKFVDV